MTSADSNSLARSIGFVGLGAMGKPMVVNLAKKAPPGSHIHVHDVVDTAAKELYDLFPNTIVKCSNAREVAEKSVRL